MNQNLATMSVGAICYCLFWPSENISPEDLLDLGEGFYSALPGLSQEMREKVALAARERLAQLLERRVPGNCAGWEQQELDFLDAMANNREFFDKIQM